MPIYQLSQKTINPAQKPWGFTMFSHGSGPNNLTYDATTDTGYYGLVASDDFITGDALAAAIGLSAGTSQHSTTSWMKFYIGPHANCNPFVRRGESAQACIVFIPQKTIRKSLSWNDIYNAGAVFGTGDNGPYNAGSNVVQDAQVTVGGYDFIVRLPTCANANPVLGDDDWACTDDIGAGSEWNDLIYRVHTNSPNCTDPTEGVGLLENSYHGGPQDGANWANYTDADMVVDHSAGSGGKSWGQETKNADTTMRIYRGYHGVGFFFSVSADDAFASFGYRPVLEMIQP